jgi:hypothetical protein
MRKFFLICALGLFSCGLHEWEENRMVEALQEALFLGSKTAASNLGTSCEGTMNCATGYLGNKLVELAVPDTVKDVLDFIGKITNLPSSIKPVLQLAVGSQQYNSFISLGKYGDSIKVALNRGAERAAPASVDVFKSAIFEMSFIDAKEVLLGNDTAATSYLRTKTYSDLQSAFSPILEEPLKLLNPNKYWKPIASNYNSFAQTYSNFLTTTHISTSSLPSLPYNALPEDLSAYLAEYATGKALDGLFLMVGKKETELRADPWGTVKASGEFISDTVGDLLGDIFTKAKDNLL